jgi:hypothetical protein
MSKIEEIRKNHRECDNYEELNSQAHRDRATLLAVLDGEWQSERPEAGKWWCALALDQ